MNFFNLINKKAKQEEIITVLDIGSSKIVCLIALLVNKKIKVIGSGCHSANGFKNGNITDAGLAKESIIAAVEQAEKEAGIVVDSVIVALNGNKISSHYLKTEIFIKNQKVSSQDIQKLIIKGVKELEQKGFEVIHYFSNEFIIDGTPGIKDPKGLIANNLIGKFHFVTAPTQLIENIINCIGNCQLDVVDCVFSPFAAGLSTLSKADKELGATIIDFGAGITSYAIFADNQLFSCGFIPIGSASITNDISKTFLIDLETAERIKSMHGAASINYTDNQKLINYKCSEYEEKNILNAELNEIISARVDEIFSILKKLLDKYYLILPTAAHNIVLTGGGSMLTDITKQVSRVFSSTVRLGKPFEIDGLSSDKVVASYSAALGVLQYLTLNNEMSENEIGSQNLHRKLINWIKNNF